MVEQTTSTAAANGLMVRDVGKNFGGLKVFRDLNFTLRQGEVLGVIGPNGAGKTTLINVICGVLKPTSGQVELDGMPISDKRMDTLARLGIVRSFQQTNTFAAADVRTNIARAIRFSGGDAETWKMLDELLVEFELSEVMDELSDTLPYGTQKILGLIIALATQPKFLLLDEPAAGLERSERMRVDRLVQHARERLGCGVLVVEHDIDLIRRICPRVIVMEAGKILADGTPDEVLSRQDVIDAYLGTSGEGEVSAEVSDADD